MMNVVLFAGRMCAGCVLKWRRCLLFFLREQVKNATENEKYAKQRKMQ